MPLYGLRPWVLDLFVTQVTRVDVKARCILTVTNDTRLFFYYGDKS